MPPGTPELLISVTLTNVLHHREVPGSLISTLHLSKLRPVQWPFTTLCVFHSTLFKSLDPQVSLNYFRFLGTQIPNPQSSQRPLLRGRAKFGT